MLKKTTNKKLRPQKTSKQWIWSRKIKKNQSIE